MVQFDPKAAHKRKKLGDKPGTSALLDDSHAGTAARDGEDEDEDVDESSLQAMADLEDEEEVIDAAAELRRLVAANKSSAILVLLKKLERYEMDLPTLQKSGIAKAVKVLKKHENGASKVAKLAKKLFQDWKELAIKAGMS